MPPTDARPGRMIALPGLVAIIAGAALLQGAFYERQLGLVLAVSIGVAAAVRARLPVAMRAAFASLGLGLLVSAAANGFPAAAAKPAATLVLVAAAFMIAMRACADEGSTAVLDALVLVVAGIAGLGILGVLAHRAPLALRAGSTWRLASTLTYQNSAGALFAIALPVAAVRALDGGLFKRSAFGLIVIALVATQSRGSLLGAVAAIVVLVCARAGAWRRLVALALVAVVAGLAIGAFHVRLDATSDDRARVWSATIEQARAHLAFGTGPGTYVLTAPKDGRVVRTEYAHNEYLQTLSETGLLGLLSVLIAIGLCAQAWWRAKRSRVWAAAGASAAAFLVCSLLDFTWRVPVLPAIAFVILAASLHAQRDDHSVADRQDRAHEGVVRSDH